MVQVPLELLKGYFISTFKATVLFARLLDGIVGQMGETVGQVVKGEFLARGAQITVRVHVALYDGIYRRMYAKDSNIELSGGEEQRSINILLDDESVS